MILAKGDKRGYLAVDREGDFYLVSRVTGHREKEVREKLGDLDRDRLLTLHQVRDQMKERTGAARHQQTAYERLEARHARALSQRRTLPDVQAARDAGGVLFAVS